MLYRDVGFAERIALRFCIFGAAGRHPGMYLSNAFDSAKGLEKRQKRSCGRSAS